MSGIDALIHQGKPILNKLQTKLPNIKKYDENEYAAYTFAKDVNERLRRKPHPKKYDTTLLKSPIAEKDLRLKGSKSSLTNFSRPVPKIVFKQKLSIDFTDKTQKIKIEPEEIKQRQNSSIKVELSLCKYKLQNKLEEISPWTTESCKSVSQL